MRQAHAVRGLRLLTPTADSRLKTDAYSGVNNMNFCDTNASDAKVTADITNTFISTGFC